MGITSAHASGLLLQQGVALLQKQDVIEQRLAVDRPRTLKKTKPLACIAVTSCRTVTRNEALANRGLAKHPFHAAGMATSPSIASSS